LGSLGLYKVDTLTLIHCQSFYISSTSTVLRLFHVRSRHREELRWSTHANLDSLSIPASWDPAPQQPNSCHTKTKNIITYIKDPFDSLVRIFFIDCEWSVERGSHSRVCTRAMRGFLAFKFCHEGANECAFALLSQTNFVRMCIHSSANTNARFVLLVKPSFKLASQTGPNKALLV